MQPHEENITSISHKSEDLRTQIPLSLLKRLVYTQREEMEIRSLEKSKNYGDVTPLTIL